MKNKIKIMIILKKNEGKWFYGLRVGMIFLARKKVL